MRPHVGEWSEWLWSVEYQQYYQERKITDNTGTYYEYEYERVAEASAQANNYTHNNPVENITSNLARSNLGHSSDSKRITGFNNPNVLHPDFKIWPSVDFEPGRVLKMLWSQPMGNGGTKITNTRENVKDSKFGEEAHHGMRRFVIVRSTTGHSLCLGISTYTGRGTLKKGAHPEYHCIIHSSKPQPLKGENTKSLNRPLKMESNNPREKLSIASRMNYAKIYTVEHDCKVHFIGKICSRDMHILAQDYNRINMVQGQDMPRTVDTNSDSYPSPEVSYASTSQPYGPLAMQSYLPQPTYPADPERGAGQAHDSTLYDDDDDNDD